MNKVILMGRLTRDPDVRYTQGEEPMAIARFTLAVDRRGKRDGQKVYTTDVVVEEAEFAESKAAADRNTQQTPPPSPDTGADGFMNIPDGIEEELPFD